MPTLDGWRAIAILAVLLTHDKVHHIGRFSLRLIQSAGIHGVDLFFAISGILILTRLLEEERSTSTINLKNFYVRRLFRIQPAALFYLFVVTLLMSFHLLDRAFREVLYSVLMVRNYLPLHDSPHAWYTDHFWSLAVEEHFYLFLPGFLLIVKKRRRIYVLSAIVASLVVWRLIVHAMPRLKFGQNPVFHTDVAALGILIASLFTLVLQNTDCRKLIYRWIRPWSMLLLLSLTIGLNPVGRSAFPDLILQCTFALLVASTMLRPQSITGQLLELPPVRWIGRISYSVYLWQMLFFDFSRYIKPTHSILLNAIQNSGWRYIAVIVLSLTSYFFIEKPMIKIGHRLAPSRIAAREDVSMIRTSI